MLLVSTDPAHSVADAFGVTVAHRPGDLAQVQSVADDLEILQLDTLALLEQRWRTLVPLLRLQGEHRHGAEFGALDPEELTGFPGVEEMLGLTEIADLAEEGTWDEIVVDCAPTAETLRLLALPETVLAYMERLWPRHRRLAGGRIDPQVLLLIGMLEQVDAAATRVRDMLRDKDSTSISLVLTPERVVAAEARRTVAMMSLHELPIDTIIVNQVLPQDDSNRIGAAESVAARWYEQRLAEQDRVFVELEAEFEGRALLRVPHTGVEPVGVEALRELAEGLVDVDGRAARSVPRSVELESGSGLESVYLMRFELPLVDSSTITLGRVEDDLVVGVAGVRRRVRLASVLRRCVVVDATMRGHELQVRFRPNPEVWPS